jgi:glycosyltransferase 2 family protein
MIVKPLREGATLSTNPADNGNKPPQGIAGFLTRYRVWIGLVISLILIYLTFRQQPLDKIGAALGQVNYIWILPALVLYFVGVWVRALRWHFLLAPILPAVERAHTSANRLFGPMAIGYAVNDLVPLRTGDVVRAYALSRQEGIRTSSALATVVIERIFDGLTMLLFIVICALFVSLGDLRNYLIVGTVIFVAAFVLFVYVAASPKVAEQLLGIVLSVLPLGRLRGRVDSIARSFLHGLSVLSDARSVVAVLLTSLIAWLLEATMYFLIAQGFSSILQQQGIAEPPLYAFLLTCAVANLVTIIPSTPGYVGPFDYAVKLVLSAPAPLFALPLNWVLSYTLVLHAALYFPITFVGLFFLWRAGISWGEISSGKTKLPASADTPADIEETVAEEEEKYDDREKPGDQQITAEGA